LIEISVQYLDELAT